MPMSDTVDIIHLSYYNFFWITKLNNFYDFFGRNVPVTKYALVKYLWNEEYNKNNFLKQKTSSNYVMKLIVQ